MTTLADLDTLAKQLYLIAQSTTPPTPAEWEWMREKILAQWGSERIDEENAPPTVETMDFSQRLAIARLNVEVARLTLEAAAR